MKLFLCSHFSSVGSLIKEEIENKKVAFIPTASLRGTVENRYAEVESYIFVEVIVHLLAEGAVNGRIVIRTEATVQAQLWVVVALGDADAVLATLQTELCSLDGGFTYHSCLEYFIWRSERNQIQIDCRRFQIEPFWCFQFDKLAKVEQG